MNHRAPPQQPTLFAAVPQPRLSRREPWPIYLAVLKLRRFGHRVYRSGIHEHVVDGRRVRSDTALVTMAAKKKGSSMSGETTGGYQVSITLHTDYSFAVISQIPTAEQRTIVSARVPQFLADLAASPTQETLEAYFENTPGGNDGWVQRRNAAKKVAA